MECRQPVSQSACSNTWCMRRRHGAITECNVTAAACAQDIHSTRYSGTTRSGWPANSPPGTGPCWDPSRGRRASLECVCRYGVLVWQWWSGRAVGTGVVACFKRSGAAAPQSAPKYRVPGPTRGGGLSRAGNEIDQRLACGVAVGMFSEELSGAGCARACVVDKMWEQGRGR